MSSSTTTPSTSADAYQVCVSTPESAPVQEGCVPGASPYPNPFMQVSEFSDAGPHGDRRKAQVTEMTSAWQQPGPSGTPTAPYTSHMMFDPSYYISSAHGMYLSRPGGGSGAFSPQMMQTAHVGGYPASTDTCIPVGRPHSVEPRGVYSPFYGYSHSYGMSQYDPRMSGDVRFSMGMTSFPGEDFARYVQAVAKMQSDHSSGEIATSPTPFASFSPPSHPYLHPYDAIYNDASGGPQYPRPRVLKSSSTQFLEEECTGQKHASNSLRRVTTALADRVQSNLPFLVSITSSHELRAKLLRAGHNEDTVSKWLKAIHQKPGKYSAQLPEIVVGAWIHKKCQDCVSLLLRTITDDVKDIVQVDPTPAMQSRKRQRSTYHDDSKAGGLETTFNAVYSDPATTAHV